MGGGRERETVVEVGARLEQASHQRPAAGACWVVAGQLLVGIVAWCVPFCGEG